MTEPNSRRRRARQIVIVVLLVVAVVSGMTLFADVQELQRNLASFDWWMLAVATALATGNYAIRFVRWQTYLRVLDLPVAPAQSALVFLAGFVMSVTPGKVGEVFKSALLLESHNYPIEKTAPIVLAERVTDLLALVLITAIGSMAFDGGIVITAAGAAIVAAVLLVCMVRPLGNAIVRLAGRMPFIGRFEPRLNSAYDSLHAVSRPGPLLVATALSTVAWGLEVGSLYYILVGLDAPIGWTESCFAYGAATIAGALAMMPGGLGVTEAGMTGLLIGLGDMEEATATAATLLTRLATLWWAVALGGIALGLLRWLYPTRRAN